MSLTDTEMVFASIHENALNDVMTAFCTDRPRYLVHGSPSFVPGTTVAETSMPSIAFPGVPGGTQSRIRFGIPRVDLFKQTAFAATGAHLARARAAPANSGEPVTRFARETTLVCEK